MVKGCDCAVLQEGLHGFHCRRGGPHGRTDSHIHIIRTIWAQTYRIRKNKRRLSENTWYVKKIWSRKGRRIRQKKVKKNTCLGKSCSFGLLCVSLKAHTSPSKSKEKKAHSKTDKRPRKTRTVNQMNKTFIELGGGGVGWCDGAG